MHRFNLAVAAAFALAVGGVCAQQAYITVTPEISPNVITLSRVDNVATAKDEAFISRAAWRFVVRNGGSNGLNNVPLTISTTAVFDTSVRTSLYDTDAIHIPPSKLEHCIANAEKNQLSCDFQSNGIGVGETSEFIVVVFAPTSGLSIGLTWNLGNGDVIGSAFATLIDGTTDPTVKTHVQSFMVTSPNNRAFTGVTGGFATLADPWTTLANLGDTLFDRNGAKRSYTKITIDEPFNPAELASCSALNKNQCWVSKVAIPDTTWTKLSPLLIELSRHSSIIKSGSKLRDYFITYSIDVGQPFVKLQSCSATDPVGPSAGVPCIDYCEQIDLVKSEYLWQCHIKALDNGSYATD